MFSAHGALASWHPWLWLHFPSPSAILTLAQCHPPGPLPHHLGNEPLLSISCPEWLSETPGSILLKLGNWKASQFLLHQDFIISFEVNFQILQTNLRSNGSMKMHVKIKKKKFFWLSPVLYPLCPCLPALHLLMERLPLHICKQLVKQSTKIPGKNDAEVFKILFHSPTLALQRQ